MAFDLADPPLEAVHVEDAGILDGLCGEEYADGRQHEGRDEFAHEGSGAAIVGQALAGDVDDPVQDEEQQREDGRRSQAALLEDGPDGRPDEEQQQAGQRLGVFLPDFHVRPVDELRVLVGFHRLAAEVRLILPGRFGGPFIVVLPVGEGGRCRNLQWG